MICEYFKQFLSNCKLKGLLPRSIQNYEEIIQRFINYTGNVEMDRLDIDLINEYIMSLYDRELSKASIGTYLRHLKVFFKFCEEKGYTKFKLSREIKIPRQPKKLITIFTNQEIQCIFDKVYIENNWIHVRNTFVISIMLDSGLRLSEVVNLKVGDVNTQKNVIKVTGKGNKERLVPAGKLSISLMNEYLDLISGICTMKSDDYLLIRDEDYKPITRNAIKLFLHKLSAQLPIDFSAHKLRHNFATNYCIDEYNRTGSMDIYKLKTLLGHEEIETTMRYMHLANQIIISNTKSSHLDLIGIRKSTQNNRI